jgi:hypothetical protein
VVLSSLLLGHSLGVMMRSASATWTIDSWKHAPRILVERIDEGRKSYGGSIAS